jgi:DNA-binding CsgD family transcriptional regulator
MVVHQFPQPMIRTKVLNRDSYTQDNNPYLAGFLEDMQLVTHLLQMGQSFCGQMQDGIRALCHEVKTITQERAQLRLGRQRTLKQSTLPSATFVTLPVQFGSIVYGSLCVTFDPVQTEQSSIPLPVAHLLAQACSWLLYMIEQSSFLQGQCQQLDYQIHGPLTRREREVLALMCQGYNQSAIAELLFISPATVGKHRQHIYEQLGVHSERDAVLVAYQTGLFSLVEDHLI